MDAPLSAYWVKFFKNAGFPSDVATRHAVIFSNNRIKPDMLPDLDKPSLKEMGITLMGDMIAILRYAKKVVEETTCKKFLVSSEDSTSATKTVGKPVAKKVIAKTTTIKALPAVTKVKMESPTKIVKATSSSIVKPAAVVKKKISPVTQTSRMYSDYIDTNQRSKTISLKRKYDSDEAESKDKWMHNDLNKRIKSNNDDIKYKVIMPKGTTNKSQKILKKALEQKRTVFHRLGESMVTSTTSVAESTSNFNPTFNITGVGPLKDTQKRNSSVFNRLGNKDNDESDVGATKLVRNGTIAQGILKSRTPSLGTKIISTKPLMRKPVGTMRADEEANKIAVSESVRQLKKLKFEDGPLKKNFIRTTPISSKLASERLEIPAKSRLGITKDVKFNNITNGSRIKKQGVFSRLGV